MFECVISLLPEDGPNGRLNKLRSIPKASTALRILCPLDPEEMTTIFLTIPKQVRVVNLEYSLTDLLSEQKKELIHQLFSFLPTNVRKLTCVFDKYTSMPTENWINFFRTISKKVKNLTLRGVCLLGQTQAGIKDILQALDGIIELNFEDICFVQSHGPIDLLSFMPASIKILHFPFRDYSTVPSLAGPSSLKHLRLHLGDFSPVVGATIAAIHSSINTLALRFYLSDMVMNHRIHDLLPLSESDIQALLSISLPHLLRAIPPSINQLEIQLLEFYGSDPIDILETLFAALPDHISDLAINSDLISQVPEKCLIELGKRLPYVLRIRSINAEHQERHDDKIRALGQNIGQRAKSLQEVLNKTTPFPKSIQLLIAEYIIAGDTKDIEEFLRPKPSPPLSTSELLVEFGLASCVIGVIACYWSLSLGVAVYALGIASFGLAYYVHSQYRPQLIDREIQYDDAEAEEKEELCFEGLECKF